MNKVLKIEFDKDDHLAMFLMTLQRLGIETDFAIRMRAVKVHFKEVP